MSREAVIRRIVEREMQGQPLTEEAVRDDAPALHRAACEVFGTWDTALHYAGVRCCRRGFEPSTPEQVIQQIRRYLQTGRRPIGTFVRRHHYRLHRDAIRCFGTWRQALSAAGVDIRRAGLLQNEAPPADGPGSHRGPASLARGRPFDGVERRLPGESPVGRRGPDDSKAWRRALLAAGIPVTTAAHGAECLWNPPRVLERIRRRHEQGKRLDENVVAHEARRLLKAAREHFGSWSEALAAAGVDPRQHVGRRAGQQDGPRATPKPTTGNPHRGGSRRVPWRCARMRPAASRFAVPHPVVLFYDAMTKSAPAMSRCQGVSMRAPPAVVAPVGHPRRRRPRSRLTMLVDYPVYPTGIRSLRQLGSFQRPPVKSGISTRAPLRSNDSFEQKMIELHDAVS